MIDKNMSGIFKNNVMGHSGEEEMEAPSQSYSAIEGRLMTDGVLKGMQPINFEEQVMGGMKGKEFFSGKLPEISGAQGYSDKMSSIFKHNYTLGNTTDMSSMLGGSGSGSGNGISKENLNVKFDFFNSVKDSVKKPMIKDNTNFNVDRFLGSGSTARGNKSMNKLNGNKSSLGGNTMFNNMFQNVKTKDKDITKNISSFFAYSGKTGTGGKGSLKVVNPTDKIKDAFSFNGVSSRAKAPINELMGNSAKGMGTAKKGFNDSMDKINMMLGNTAKKNADFGKYNPVGSNVKNLDIKGIIGMNPGTKFNVGINMGAGSDVGKVVGTSMGGSSFGALKYITGAKGSNDKISAMLGGLGIGNSTKDISKLFGTMGNPEKSAHNRIKSQKGLSMFGDYDGDGVANILDCNPLNYFEQGKRHNLSKFLHPLKDKFSKNSEEEGEDSGDSGDYEGEYLSLEELPEQITPAFEEETFDPDKGMSEGVDEEGYVEEPKVTFNLVPDSQADYDYDMGNTVGGYLSSGNEEVDSEFVDPRFIPFQSPTEASMQSRIDRDEAEELERQQPGFFSKVASFAGKTLLESPTGKMIANNPIVRLSKGESVEDVMGRGTPAMKEFTPESKRILNEIYRSPEGNDSGELGRSNQLNQIDLELSNYYEKMKDPSLDAVAKGKIITNIGSLERIKGQLGQDSAAMRSIKLSEKKYEDSKKERVAKQSAQTEQMKLANMLKMKEIALKTKGAENVMWENKLKAGHNLFGNLLTSAGSIKNLSTISGTSGAGMAVLSGSDKLTGMSRSGQAMENQFMLTGGVGAQGGGARDALGTFGGQAMFGSKVAESVGDASGLFQAPKSFSEKVGESVGRGSSGSAGSSVYDFIRSSNIQRTQGLYGVPQMPNSSQMSSAPRISEVEYEDDSEYIEVEEPQVRPMPQPQMQAAPMQQVPQTTKFEAMQRMYQQPQAMSQGMQGYAAQPMSQGMQGGQGVLIPGVPKPIIPERDADYLKYMQETEGENKYRRGPYKKSK